MRFQKGRHWRSSKPWWDRAWLEAEYIAKCRSASEIAAEGGCTENNILYWLYKHGIPRRSVSEARKLKRWETPSGQANPMYGRRGYLNPNWKGGLTPARQGVYGSSLWRAVARRVRSRDKVCRLCGNGDRCEIHHIISFSSAPLLVLHEENLILLCYGCHKKIYGQERRWEKRLLRLVAGGR